MKRAVTLLLLAALGAAATAQPVYRCGNAYADTPCPAGKLVDASDARTHAQRADALKLASLDQQRSAQMERERLASQAAEEKNRAKSTAAKTPKPKRIRATPIRWVRL